MKVFQRRIDSSLDFYRDWNEYKTGFGSADGNFWLGNDKLSALTSQGQYELRIDFVSKSGQHHYAKYSSFSVGNEGTNYRLSVSGYDSSSSVGEYLLPIPIDYHPLYWLYGSRTSSSTHINNFSPEII